MIIKAFQNGKCVVQFEAHNIEHTNLPDSCDPFVANFFAAYEQLITQVSKVVTEHPRVEIGYFDMEISGVDDTYTEIK